MKKATLLKQDLIARGWTRSLIERFLGEPDDMPHRYGGGHLCIYDEDRVLAAEASPEWQRSLYRIQSRKENPAQTIDLLAAIFAVNRATKRFREAAQVCYRK